MTGRALQETAEVRDPTVNLGPLIQRLSEPESGPPADNLITNEDSFPRVCGEIERDVAPGGVYLGVGPDQNLTYIAHARPSLAFVIDFRRGNLLLHLLHKALFQIADDRASYLTRLLARRPHTTDRPEHRDAEAIVRAYAGVALDRALLEETRIEVARALGPKNAIADEEWAEIARIHARLAGPGLNARFLALPIYPTFGQLIRTPDRAGNPAHFLASEASYRIVRDLHRGDRIVPIVGDFAGAGALPLLADWLREHRLIVRLMYVSDVEFFLLRGGRFDAYIENLSRFPWAEEARIIRSSTRPIEHPERVAGDQSTTILRPVAPFLEAARSGRIRTVDDLFAL